MLSHKNLVPLLSSELHQENKMYQHGQARYVRAVFVLLFLCCTTIIIEIEP